MTIQKLSLTVTISVVCLVFGVAISMRLDNPILGILTSVLLALQPPSWLLSAKLRTNWLPLLLAGGYIVSISMLLHYSLGRGFERFLTLSIAISIVFFLGALFEGVRAIRLIIEKKRLISE